jgi:DNA-binding CsgD family transcriptional regulator
VLVAVFAVIDLGVDLYEGARWTHVLTESTVFMVALAGSLVLGRHLIRQAAAARRAAVALARHLEASNREADRWRSEAHGLLQELGAAMDHQFEAWQLTSAEKEVSLLLLKGLSHKEIAAVRGNSEATTRQQARSVYRKAGLNGRRELSAFFLEGISLPAGIR